MLAGTLNDSLRGAQTMSVCPEEAGCRNLAGQRPWKCWTTGHRLTQIRASPSEASEGQLPGESWRSELGRTLTHRDLELSWEGPTVTPGELLLAQSEASRDAVK